jgi:hypothetical protein
MLNWFHQLDRATTVADVVRVTRDYLATWPPETLALLPAECRPGRVKSHEDIDELHASLAEEYRQTRLEGTQLSALQRMTSFIVRASMRLVQLDGEEQSRAQEPPAPKSREPSTKR